MKSITMKIETTANHRSTAGTTVADFLDQSDVLSVPADQPRDWLVRVYDRDDRVIETWTIKQRTENEAVSEVEDADLGMFDEVGNWTLSPLNVHGGEGLPVITRTADILDSIPRCPILIGEVCYWCIGGATMRGAMTVADVGTASELAVRWKSVLSVRQYELLFYRAGEQPWCILRREDGSYGMDHVESIVDNTFSKERPRKSRDWPRHADIWDVVREEDSASGIDRWPIGTQYRMCYDSPRSVPFRIVDIGRLNDMLNAYPSYRMSMEGKLFLEHTSPDTYVFVSKLGDQFWFDTAESLDEDVTRGSILRCSGSMERRADAINGLDLGEDVHVGDVREWMDGEYVSDHFRIVGVGRVPELLQYFESQLAVDPSVARWIRLFSGSDYTYAHAHAHAGLVYVVYEYVDDQKSAGVTNLDKVLLGSRPWARTRMGQQRTTTADIIDVVHKSELRYMVQFPEYVYKTVACGTLNDIRAQYEQERRMFYLQATPGFSWTLDAHPELVDQYGDRRGYLLECISEEPLGYTGLLNASFYIFALESIVNAVFPLVETAQKRQADILDSPAFRAQDWSVGDRYMFVSLGSLYEITDVGPYLELAAKYPGMVYPANVRKADLKPTDIVILSRRVSSTWPFVSSTYVWCDTFESLEWSTQAGLIRKTADILDSPHINFQPTPTGDQLEAYARQFAYDLQSIGFTDGVDRSPEISLYEYGILRNPQTTETLFFRGDPDTPWEGRFDVPEIDEEAVREALSNETGGWFDARGLARRDVLLQMNPTQLAPLIVDLPYLMDMVDYTWTLQSCVDNYWPRIRHMSAGGQHTPRLSRTGGLSEWATRDLHVLVVPKGYQEGGLYRAQYFVTYPSADSWTYLVDFINQGAYEEFEHRLAGQDHSGGHAAEVRRRAWHAERVGDAYELETTADAINGALGIPEGYTLGARVRSIKTGYVYTLVDVGTRTVLRARYAGAEESKKVRREPGSTMCMALQHGGGQMYLKAFSALGTLFVLTAPTQAPTSVRRTADIMDAVRQEESAAAAAEARAASGWPEGYYQGQSLWHRETWAEYVLLDVGTKADLMQRYPQARLGYTFNLNTGSTELGFAVSIKGVPSPIFLSHLKHLFDGYQPRSPFGARTADILDSPALREEWSVGSRYRWGSSTEKSDLWEIIDRGEYNAMREKYRGQSDWTTDRAGRSGDIVFVSKHIDVEGSRTMLSIETLERFEHDLEQGTMRRTADILDVIRQEDGPRVGERYVSDAFGTDFTVVDTGNMRELRARYPLAFTMDLLSDGEARGLLVRLRGRLVLLLCSRFDGLVWSNLIKRADILDSLDDQNWGVGDQFENVQDGTRYRIIDRGPLEAMERKYPDGEIVNEFAFPMRPIVLVSRNDDAVGGEVFHSYWFDTQEMLDAESEVGQIRRVRAGHAARDLAVVADILDSPSIQRENRISEQCRWLAVIYDGRGRTVDSLVIPDCTELAAEAIGGQWASTNRDYTDNPQATWSLLLVEKSRHSLGRSQASVRQADILDVPGVRLEWEVGDVYEYDYGGRLGRSYRSQYKIVDIGLYADICRRYPRHILNLDSEPPDAQDVVWVSKSVLGEDRGILVIDTRESLETDFQSGRIRKTADILDVLRDRYVQREGTTYTYLVVDYGLLRDMVPRYYGKRNSIKLLVWEWNGSEIIYAVPKAFSYCPVTVLSLVGAGGSEDLEFYLMVDDSVLADRYKDVPDPYGRTHMSASGSVGAGVSVSVSVRTADALDLAFLWSVGDRYCMPLTGQEYIIVARGPLKDLRRQYLFLRPSNGLVWHTYPSASSGFVSKGVRGKYWYDTEEMLAADEQSGQLVRIAGQSRTADAIYLARWWTVGSQYRLTKFGDVTFLIVDRGALRDMLVRYPRLRSGTGAGIDAYDPGEEVIVSQCSSDNSRPGVLWFDTEAELDAIVHLAAQVVQADALYSPEIDVGSVWEVPDVYKVKRYNTQGRWRPGYNRYWVRTVLPLSEWLAQHGTTDARDIGRYVQDLGNAHLRRSHTTERWPMEVEYVHNQENLHKRGFDVRVVVFDGVPANGRIRVMPPTGMWTLAPFFVEDVRYVGTASTMEDAVGLPSITENTGITAARNAPRQVFQAAAIVLPDGRMYIGEYHADAVHQFLSEEFPDTYDVRDYGEMPRAIAEHPQYREGFITMDDRFVDREEAARMVNLPADVGGEADSLYKRRLLAGDRTFVRTYAERKVMSARSAPLELFVAAAFLVAGQIFTGVNHPQATLKYLRTIIPDFDDLPEHDQYALVDEYAEYGEDGFITAAGRYVDRETAAEMMGLPYAEAIAMGMRGDI